MTELLFFAGGLITAGVIYLVWWLINTSREVAKLKERLDVYIRASKRGRPHQGWNERAGEENIWSRLELLAMNNKRDADLIDTTIAEVVRIRQGKNSPDKPDRDYLKVRSNL